MELKGTIEEIIYKNDDNNYKVIALELEDGEYIMAVGNLYGVYVGDDLVMHGQYVNHKTYGEQFKIESFYVELPKDEEKIESFLASGQIEGIGKKTAKRIVDRFGADTLDIMNYAPEKLLEIKGISKSKLGKIIDSFEHVNAYRDSYVFLNSLGFGPNATNRIIDIYKNQTTKLIMDNPYRLSEEIDGIGFLTADKIARRLGIETDSPYRIRSYIVHKLYENSNRGHCYMDEDYLKSILLDELGITKDVLEKEFQEQLIKGSIIRSADRIYLSRIYNAEVNTASTIFSRTDLKNRISIRFGEAIDEFEKENGIKFSDTQLKAIHDAIVNPTSIITGGPGTGKTTIIKAIVKIFDILGMKMKLAAPTGRAAKRMTEATLKEAQTLHRMLDYKYLEGVGFVFGKNEDDRITADVIIVDEFSMVDILLIDKLLKAMREDTILIMIGDKDQLPSVGPGNVLKDMIASGTIPVTILDTIYRQSENSFISLNAKAILEGREPSSNVKEGDFFTIIKSNQRDILKEVVSLSTGRLQSHYGLDFLTDIQVLCPTKIGMVGTRNVNEVLQKLLNPPSDDKGEFVLKTRTFRTGDKVMQTKNNYFLEWQDTMTLNKGQGVFNGEIGFITAIDEKAKKAQVVFDGTKEVVYDIFSIGDLELAYSITVHKSQGSEFKCVIIPVSALPEILASRNLLYTAVTRAKTLVVIVGDPRHIKAMIDRFDTTTRNTGLQEMLENLQSRLT